jgi:hypothetical protein
MTSQATSDGANIWRLGHVIDVRGTRSFLMMEAGQHHDPFVCVEAGAIEPCVRCLQAPSRQLKLGNHMIFLSRMYGTHHVLTI